MSILYILHQVVGHLFMCLEIWVSCQSGSCCPDSAVIWRGPKKNGMIKQFLKDVDWCSTDEEGEELSQTEENEESKGEKEKEERIEYMIIDTPPGTTDEHLSIVSYLKETSITGAIIVTTPQEVSIQDVRRII
ncbi:hypothetical protein Pst134EB_002170 [Puccinia striiformis f. sp. tritici]|nr:hypothetical protein Pst134EB_002170 [Puccinia striiformis f. sp. tritici]